MIITLLLYILRLAEILILIRCVLSFMPSLYNGFTRFVYAVTEPVLSPIRDMLGRFGSGMMFDLSPMVAMIIISLLERVIYIIF